MKAAQGLRKQIWHTWPKALFDVDGPSNCWQLGAKVALRVTGITTKSASFRYFGPSAVEVRGSNASGLLIRGFCEKEPAGSRRAGMQVLGGPLNLACGPTLG